MFDDAEKPRPHRMTALIVCATRPPPRWRQQPVVFPNLHVFCTVFCAMVLFQIATGKRKCYRLVTHSRNEIFVLRRVSAAKRERGTIYENERVDLCMIVRVHKPVLFSARAGLFFPVFLATAISILCIVKVEAFRVSLK